MAAGTHREDSKPTINPAKHKYMRFMQVGLSIFFACPAAIAFIGTFRIKVDSIILAVAMIGLAVFVFAIGYTGWQELKERGLKGSEDKIGDTKTEVLCSKEKTVLP